MHACMQTYIYSSHLLFVLRRFKGVRPLLKFDVFRNG